MKRAQVSCIASEGKYVKRSSLQGGAMVGEGREVKVPGSTERGNWARGGVSRDLTVKSLSGSCQIYIRE